MQTSVTRALGIEHPIVQAPIGGAEIVRRMVGEAEATLAGLAEAMARGAPAAR